jgi:hypothetical protein
MCINLFELIVNKLRSFVDSNCNKISNFKFLTNFFVAGTHVNFWVLTIKWDLAEWKV